MRSMPLLCALLMLRVGAHASSSHVAHLDRRIVHVRLSVDAWNDSGVAAVLIDRTAKRTGWLKGRPIREIQGCLYEYAYEEGLPQGTDDDDSGAPMFHHFTVQDSAHTPGLIRQGGCELRLAPDVGGKVQLILLADGVGFPECRDTMSVWVKPGIRTRWWLTWKVAVDSCIVKISPMRGRTPARKTAR
jgi:hypothetical protein